MISLVEWLILDLPDTFLLTTKIIRYPRPVQKQVISVLNPL